jgi:hypothetical protein
MIFSVMTRRLFAKQVQQPPAGQIQRESFSSPPCPQLSYWVICHPRAPTARRSNFKGVGCKSMSVNRSRVP